jgi:alcohol dehydrogenase (cytochrome c)
MLKARLATVIVGCATIALAFGVAFGARPGARAAVAAAAVTPAYPAVTNARLLDAAKDDGWLMFLRTYRSEGHAPFTEVNARNVAQLREVFTHHVTIPEGYEAPPIVNGRTMIVTTPLDRVYALDATTGKTLWEYDYPVPKQALRTACCDMVNRGVALYGSMAYMATLDSHVLGIDAATGKVVWNATVYPTPGVGYTMTSAPLVVKGLVIVGDGAGEYGGRGFLVALDAKTGAERWRTYTIPAPREAGGKTWPGTMYLHGGGDPWITGSYDAETDTLLWGTGNPSPWLWSERKGRNLYSDSVLAIDPATGRIKWFFQQTPNDPWDYDATNSPVLADVTIAGRKRKVFYQAGRNGWFYVVDRTNGKFILMQPFTKVTSVTGYDAAHGIGTVDAALKPRPGKNVFTCPAFFGGDNWWSYSYDPQTGYAYVPTMKTCMTMGALKPTPFKAGAGYLNESFTVQHVPGVSGWGALQAIEVATGKRKWSMDARFPWNDGTLTTDGGLVFSGTPDQKFYALDARTGKVLWEHRMTSGVIGQPVTYRVDGRQYIAVQSGWGGVSPFWGGPNMTPMFKHIPLGGRLYVFALPVAGDKR